MKAIFILISLMVLKSIMASESIGCGKQASSYPVKLNKNTRIIGGTEAKAHSWPWLATLNTDSDDSGGCGASLIRVNDKDEKSYILVTAAHCVTRNMDTTPEASDVEQYSVVAGNHLMNEFDKGEIRRSISQIRFHPQFKLTPDTAANDLALIKLGQPISFSDTIRPICLPAASAELPVGKTCFVAGWGHSGDNSDSDRLQQLLNVPLLPDICKQAWTVSYSEKTQICAQSLNPSKSNACNGDSGGMFACQEKTGGWTLYGVTSFGDNECIGKPGVYTRVSAFTDWIAKNVKEMTSLKV